APPTRPPAGRAGRKSRRSRTSAVALEPVRGRRLREQERLKGFLVAEGSDEELGMRDRLLDLRELVLTEPAGDLLKSVPGVDRRREAVKRLVGILATRELADHLALERERQWSQGEAHELKRRASLRGDRRASIQIGEEHSVGTDERRDVPQRPPRVARVVQDAEGKDEVKASRSEMSGQLQQVHLSDLEAGALLRRAQLLDGGAQMVERGVARVDGADVAAELEQPDRPASVAAARVPHHPTREPVARDAQQLLGEDRVDVLAKPRLGQERAAVRELPPLPVE